MWCPHCQAEVATQVAADGQSLLCTSCGGEVRKVFAPSLHPETRSARELLERWTASELLADVEGGLPPHDDDPPPSPTRERATAPPASSRPAPSKPKFRIDAAHSTHEVVGQVDERVTTPHAHAPRGRDAADRGPLPDGYRQDVAHPLHAGPHFELPAAIEAPAASGQSESLWGQMLAYLGVGVLTVGTVLVLWGHFGGVASYASNGWLVATAGQMLLLLGVVTLISGGMQQTTHEVTRRVQSIGERMGRIERSAEALLRGPHFGQGADAGQPRAAVARDDDAQH